MTKLYKKHAYKRLILGFFGIVVDTGVQYDNLKKSAAQLKKVQNETVPSDMWGSIGSYRNVGFSGWVSDDYLSLYTEERSQGAIGGLLRVRASSTGVSLGLVSAAGAYHRRSVP